MNATPALPVLTTPDPDNAKKIQLQNMVLAVDFVLSSFVDDASVIFGKNTLYLDGKCLHDVLAEILLDERLVKPVVSDELTLAI